MAKELKIGKHVIGTGHPTYIIAEIGINHNGDIKIAEEMIEYYQKATGIIIRPYIEEIEVATPVTFSRYLGTPNGTPYGYQTRDWDGIFLRTMNLLKERTIKNFRFCGAHTENSLGYNQTYKSGKIAVEELEKKRK